MTEKIIKKTNLAAAYIFLGLLAYLPFHIFISTVVGVNLGGLEFFKASKDILVLLVSILVLPFTVYQWKYIKKTVLSEKIVLLGIAFMVINALFFLMNNKDLDSALLGLVYNTRYLALFVVLLILTKANPQLLNVRNLTRIVLISSLVVSVLGILQYFIIPKDFLATLGYSMKNGALPWFYIDDKPDFFRIMSTMRDPNSLGSYLLIPITLLLAKLATQYKELTRRVRVGICAAIVINTLALLLAFSRSAVVGLIASVCVLVLVVYKGYIRRNIKSITLVTLSVVALILISGLVFLQVNPRAFKNIVLHADEQTVMRDPNELRVDFIRDSIDEISDKPMGSGLGTAGLASMKNDIQGVNLTENYYLQLAIEIGVFGMIIFLLVCALTAQKLFTAWRASGNYVSAALLASLSGLFVTNMLAHIWTNETIAITWWGMAAVCIAQFTIKAPKK